MNRINSQKGFVVPLVIAIVAILIVGGVYAATRKTKVPTLPANGVVSTSTPTSTNAYEPAIMNAESIISPTNGEKVVKGDSFSIKWIVSKDVPRVCVVVDTLPGAAIVLKEECTNNTGLYTLDTSKLNLVNQEYEVIIVDANAFDNNWAGHSCTVRFTLIGGNAPASNLKTYSNSKYGFEVSYPRNFVFVEDGTIDFPHFTIQEDKSTSRGPIITGSVDQHAYIYNGDIVSFVKTNYSKSYSKIEKIEYVSLGRLNGAKVFGAAEDGLGIKSTVIDIYAIDPNQSKLLYKVRFWNYQGDTLHTDEFDTILSSFKFTN